jgi:hypothetical protein
MQMKNVEHKRLGSYRHRAVREPRFQRLPGALSLAVGIEVMDSVFDEIERWLVLSPSKRSRTSLTQTNR